MPLTHQRILAHHLQSGVVCHPTDTIVGISCLPKNSTAIQKILYLKKRAASKGFILLAAQTSHLAPFVENGYDLSLLTKKHTIPTTYLVPAKKGLNTLITGKHKTVAIRLTQNPLIKFLCSRLKSAIVSTSANVSGKKPATTRTQILKLFGNQLNYIYIPPDTVLTNLPSTIVNLSTGVKIR